MPGEALTLFPFLRHQPAAADGRGRAAREQLDRCLRRLSAARVPLVLVEVETRPGAGQALLPYLAELGLASELAADRLLLLFFGPAAAVPGCERRIAARVKALPGCGGARVTALRLESDSLASLDDLRSLLALEAPVTRPLSEAPALPPVA